MKPAINLCKIFLIFFLLTAGSYSYGQYLPEWAKGFGGDRQDRGRAFLQTPSGDFIITGEASRRRTNMWLLKMKPDGTELRGKVFEDSYFSQANAIAGTPDMKIVTAGEYIKTRRKQDVNGFIMVSDSTGEPVWLKEYGENLEDAINDLIISSAGEYVAVGWSEGGDETQKRLWFLRTDERGEVLSEKFFWETDEDVGNTLCETSDGNFVVGGYALYGEKRTMRIMKLDGQGEVLWDLPFVTENINEIHDIIEADDDCIYACGTYRVQPLTDYNDLLVKISPEGEMLYMKTYGSHNWEEATTIAFTHDNYIVLGGFEKSKDEVTADFKVRKLDTAGVEDALFTFRKQSLDYAEQITETADKGLLLVGSTYKDGKGWDYAALKFKNIHRTEAAFIYPETSFTTGDSLAEIKICINSFELPKEIAFYYSDSLLITDIYNKMAVAENACLYPVYLNVKLRGGINRFRIVVTDKHGYVAEDEILIRYIPDDELNW